MNKSIWDEIDQPEIERIRKTFKPGVLELLEWIDPIDPYLGAPFFKEETPYDQLNNLIRYKTAIYYGGKFPQHVRDYMKETTEFVAADPILTDLLDKYEQGLKKMNS